MSRGHCLAMIYKTENPMKKKTKTAKRSTKPKAKKTKAKPTKVLKAKTKSKSSPKHATKKKSKGLSVVELFQMKTQSEQNANQSGDDWKHKKDFPPQEQLSKEDLRAKNNAGAKKTGFGGARHH